MTASVGAHLRDLTIDGRRARWVWGTPDDPFGPGEPRLGGIPAAILLDHGDHNLLVPWAQLHAGPEVTPFRLESLVPLTVAELIVCGSCGARGRLVADRWERA